MRIWGGSLSALLLLASVAQADTITLADGRTVTGSFVGGDSRTIRVALGDRVETYAISDVRNISFGDGYSSAAPAYPPSYPQAAPQAPLPPPVLRDRDADQRAAAQPPYPQSYPQAPPPPPPSSFGGPEIPNGTVLTVRMIDNVDSERDSMGQNYRASLDEPVMDGRGRTLVPRGSDVIVKLVDDKESGKLEGKTVLTLDVVSLRIDGRDVPIDTATVTQESASRTGRSAKVIGGTAVLGTIIGAIAGGGKGAAIGAASGAGVGTAAQVMTKGQRVRIPSETRLTFTLQQPVRL
jgi:hypothetical protein